MSPATTFVAAGIIGVFTVPQLNRLSFGLATDLLIW
jgi:hypothetical protein